MNEEDLQHNLQHIMENIAHNIPDINKLSACERKRFWELVPYVILGEMVANHLRKVIHNQGEQ